MARMAGAAEDGEEESCIAVANCGHSHGGGRRAWQECPPEDSEDVAAGALAEHGSHRRSGVTGFSSVEATQVPGPGASAFSRSSGCYTDTTFSAARSSPPPRCCCCACVAVGLTVSFSLIAPAIKMWTQLLIARSTTCLQTANNTPAKPAEAGPQLKLLVDKRSRRVLYAEARKDVVDFLIGLLRDHLADANVSLEEFGDSLCPPIPCAGELLTLPKSNSAVVTDPPLLYVQVTRLRCGGFVFVTQICHNLVDTVGITQSVSSRKARSVRPGAPRRPPRPAYDHPEYEPASDEASDKLRPRDELVHRRFFFGPDDVTALHDQLPTRLGSRCLRFLLLASPGPDRRFPLPAAADTAPPPAPAALARRLPLPQPRSPTDAASPPAPAALAHHLPCRRRQPADSGSRNLPSPPRPHAAPPVAVALAEERRE
uniref:Uncharacterized protein n=1 Tax=Oryza barthii TaxID=65489 RepID=A0A0D3HS44_9ORYZ